MLEGQNSASPPCLSHERSFTGCETLSDWSGSSASFPGLLKVVGFFSSLLGFAVSANETLVGDFLGLKIGLSAGRLFETLLGFPKTEVGVLDGLLLGTMDGLLSESVLGKSDDPSRGEMDGLLMPKTDGSLEGLLLGEMDGPLDGALGCKMDGPLLGKCDGPRFGKLDGKLDGKLVGEELSTVLLSS